MAASTRGWRIGPRSIRAQLPLQARRDRGLVPGAARPRHDDLPDFRSGAAAGCAACLVRNMPTGVHKEMVMEGSKKHYVDNTARFASAGLIIRQKEPKN